MLSTRKGLTSAFRNLPNMDSQRTFTATPLLSLPPPCLVLVSACWGHNSTQYLVLLGIGLLRKGETEIAFTVWAVLTTCGVWRLQLL